jgi:glycine betaine/proline transport system substrate-binding protein
MHKPHRYTWYWSVLLVIAAATTSSCGGKTTTSTPTTQPTIKLAANPWTGSRVDAAVAQVLLENQLGFRVDIVPTDENMQWVLIADGELQASLEVWPSGHTRDIQTYIDAEHLVENGGPLGPVGKIGWYVPTYVRDAHPELATWEGLQDPNLVALFRTAATGDKGRFLAGDPTWVQFDQQIIDNLGLDLQVEVAGSEQALLAEVDAAYRRGVPILFYFWTPHAAHQLYQLAEVALPPYSESCYAKADDGGVACDYPSEPLMKILWAGLKDYAPRAYEFLKNFRYSTSEQTKLLALVDLDGQTPEAAARTWIEQNPDVWRSWIPASAPP